MFKNGKLDPATIDGYCLAICCVKLEEFREQGDFSKVRQEYLDAKFKRGEYSIERLLNPVKTEVQLATHRIVTRWNLGKVLYHASAMTIDVQGMWSEMWRGPNWKSGTMAMAVIGMGVDEKTAFRMVYGGPRLPDVGKTNIYLVVMNGAWQACRQVQTQLYNHHENKLSRAEAAEMIGYLQSRGREERSADGSLFAIQKAMTALGVWQSGDDLTEGRLMNKILDHLDENPDKIEERSCWEVEGRAEHDQGSTAMDREVSREPASPNEDKQSAFPPSKRQRLIDGYNETLGAAKEVQSESNADPTGTLEVSKDSSFQTPDTDIAGTQDEELDYVNDDLTMEDILWSTDDDDKEEL